MRTPPPITMNPAEEGPGIEQELDELLDVLAQIGARRLRELQAEAATPAQQPLKQAA